MPVQFDHPGWLLLLVLLVPTFIMSRRSIGGLSRTKANVTFAIRALFIVLLTAAIAEPVWEKRGEGLTVTLIIDRSDSIPPALQRETIDLLREAANAKTDPMDRLAIVTVGQEATICGMPDVNTRLGTLTDPPHTDATNLAEGIRTGLAIAPDETANRFVLVSDGNETIDSVLAAADLAKANDIPIDVLVLAYEHEREVIFDRLVAPPRARQGQSADLRLVLRTQADTTGRILLKMNDVFVDLNGDAPGTAMGVALDAGRPNVFPVTVSFDEPGPIRYEAIFEPDDESLDAVVENNRAMGVTFVGGEGKVLIVDDGMTESVHLVRGLREAGLTVELQETAALGAGPVYLAGFDAIVLANIPRFALTDDEDRAIHAYVHDLGGGLVMLGGPQSFGAGGWIDSDVARALPVKLDPPQTRQMVRGALVLIMHATELAQANYWGQVTAIKAIEALSRLDYVGILDYDWGGAGNPSGVNWAHPLSLAGDKAAPIAAAKRMTMGDMPDFAAAMQQALNALMLVSAGKRHVVIISDGDPQKPKQKLLDQYVAAGVTVTTVLFAGHGTPIDRKAMKDIATYTGGNFYEPKNPNKLPGIFIQEAQIVSRSLLVEGDFQPQVVVRLPGPTQGYAAVPAIRGYVLTANREGLSQIPIVNATSEGTDPIYAYWNYGIGKSIAFTPDLTGRWGTAWVSWSEFKAFWEQSIRWVMRPSAPTNMLINTGWEGDRAIVDLEALDLDASFLNFLRISAAVLQPDGEATPIEFPQTGPGRYRGEFKTDREGAYLVNINFAAGSGEDRVEGNIQAAVSVPYPREFKAVKHNAALLHDLARRTGGRILTPSDLVPLDFYERATLEVPRSPRAVWDLLLIIAAGLFVFDVAARRLSVSRKEMQEFAARTVGKRPEVGSGTVSAWKRVAGRRDEKQQARRDARRHAEATFEAGDSDVSIDVAAEAAQDVRPGLRTATPKPSSAKTEDPDPDEGDYTSRLLAAKRRARAQRDGEKGGSDA